MFWSSDRKKLRLTLPFDNNDTFLKLLTDVVDTFWKKHAQADRKRKRKKR